MNSRCINSMKIRNSSFWRITAVIFLATLQVAAFLVLIHASRTATAAPAAPDTTITVNTTSDVFDVSGKSCSNVVIGDLPGTDTKTSLREAICASNNTTDGAPHTIAFNLAVSGVQTITLAAGYSQLPDVTQPVTIDGSTEPGYSGSPLVVITGPECLYCNGLVVSSGNTTIKSLAINQFSNALIQLKTNGGNTIRDCYLGTNAAGDADLNAGNYGIQVYGSPSNQILNNLISGNGYGISIELSSSRDNVIRGNKIGTNASGTSEIPNTSGGIYATSSPTTTVGGTGTGEGNLISGNDGYGVFFYQAPGSTMQGNKIGTDITGTGDLGNSSGIVFISSGNATIGGSTANAGNLISGNDNDGISLYGAGCSNIKIQGNKIGTDGAGAQELENGGTGIYVSDSGLTSGQMANILIGGLTPAEGNLISGNASQGIYVGGNGGYIITGTKILGNRIGTNANGTDDIGNQDGIGVQAGHVEIGGSEAGAGNLVSGNHSEGIWIYGYSGGPFVTDIQIQGNKIGTNAAGSSAIGNTGDGITIWFAKSIQVGGGGVGEGNLISGNGEDGISVVGDIYTSTLITIQGNLIGVDATGAMDLGNDHFGVELSGAFDNLVGGSSAGQGNTISGNGWNGLMVRSSTNPGEFVARGNRIFGNKIGTNASGTAAIPNDQSGIYITNSPDTIIGRGNPNEGNLISGNAWKGIVVEGSDSTNTRIKGNKIGTNFSGSAAIGNGQQGIFIATSGNYIGGSMSDSSGNLVSGNQEVGIYIAGAGAIDNFIYGNKIGTNLAGTVAIGNGSSGIVIDNGDGNTIGGPDENQGNLISGNQDHGISIGNYANSNVIRSNRIGTSADGLADLGNSNDGVWINCGSSTVIGGSGAGQGNLISGNSSAGIMIYGSSSTNNQIYGNQVGLNALGAATLPNAGGVVIRGDASDNLIGGINSGESNTIAGNSGLGVSIEGDNTRRNLISGNSIFDNDGLGISLGASDVTWNDYQDPDTGPNLLQNFPVIYNTEPSNGSTKITGVFNSLPSNQFTLQFFSVPTCDSLGYGEGKVYLGSTTVNTDSNGDADFNLTLPFSATLFHYLTAIAIDSQNNTSEFSNCSLIGIKVFMPVVKK